MKHIDSRAIIHTGLTFGGHLMVLAMAGYMVLQRLEEAPAPSLGRAQLEFFVIAIGIVISQIGVFKTANRVLPERRVYQLLRDETDRFIDMVRRLNRAKISGKTEKLAAVESEMRAHVDVLVAAAGVENPEALAEAQEEAQSAA